MTFEDLDVFKRAYSLSLEIHKDTLELPRHEQYDLASQIRRASKSVCANIAEGYGKQSFSKAEFKRYLQIAVGSADEMRLWLKYCFDLGYMEQEKYESYGNEYVEIARMLTGLIRTWR